MYYFALFYHYLCKLFHLWTQVYIHDLRFCKFVFPRKPYNSIFITVPSRILLSTIVLINYNFPYT